MTGEDDPRVAADRTGRDRGGSRQTGRDRDGSAVTRRGALRGLAAVGAVGVPTVTAGGTPTGATGVRDVDQDSSDGWVQGAKLRADDGESPDGFGGSVAVSGATIVVGADGDENAEGLSSGAAYVFEYDDGWQQAAKLLPDQQRGEDQFGRSVAVSGSTAVVGARTDTNENGHVAGAAYVFENDGDGWRQTARLLPADGMRQDYFGRSVAVSGTTAVVGAEFLEREDEPHGGGAYVFEDDGDGWRQTGKLAARTPATEDRFGHSVAAGGSTVVVGAPHHSSSGGYWTGRTYVFSRAPDGWRPRATLTPSEPAEEGRFGHSVSASPGGRSVLVGAPEERAANGSETGAAYLFDSSDDWGLVTRLTAEDGASGDSFGDAVGLGESTAVVSAYDDATANGDTAGSVYVFESGDGWQQVDRVAPDDGSNDQAFAAAVDVSGPTIVAGAFGDDGPGGDFRGAAYTFARAGDGPAAGSGGGSSPDRREDDATGGTPTPDAGTEDDDPAVGGRDWSFPAEWVVAALGGATVGAYWLGNRRRDDRSEE